MQLNTMDFWSYNPLPLSAHFSKKSLLDPALDNPGIFRVIILVQVSSDDGGWDGAWGIDDLLNARHPQGDVYSQEWRKSDSLVFLSGFHFLYIVSKQTLSHNN